MKWLLVILPLLVGLIAAVGTVAAVGSFLPIGHRATRAVRFQRPVEEVWATVTDFAGQASWRSDLRGVERLPDRNGHAVWNEVSRRGEAMPLEVEVVEPPRRMVTRIADPGLPFGGTWAYELAPADGGCTLRITEKGEVYNPVFRYISRVIGHTGTIDGYLRALGRKFGEDVVIGP